MKKILGIFLIVIAVTLGVFVVRENFFFSSNESTLEISNPTLKASNVSTSSLPARLLVPKLGIDTNVQRLGITASGHMAAPNNLTDVSWYKFGTPPGMQGSAVMAGHEDNALTIDGVFKHLDQLVNGDDVYVITEGGEKIHFRVTGSQIYPFDNVPLEQVFNADDGIYLNLITCAGSWLASAKTNDKRLVVYTKLVD